MVDFEDPRRTEEAKDSLVKTLESSSEKLTSELYKQFYSPDRDLERVALIFDEILSREDEGRSVLRHLSKGSDKLSDTTNSILKQGEVDLEDIERTLGMERLADVVDIEEVGVLETKKRAHRHAVEKGYTDLSFRECMQNDEFVLFTDRLLGLPGHLAGTVENKIFQFESTFGSFEPTYLELLGPRNILDIRERGKQNALLLGSYGKYSASDFKDFCEKVGEGSITPNVIDIDSLSISLMHEDNKDKKKRIVQADASRLPYMDESLSSVYTNHLFHLLGGPDLPHEVVKENIRLLFEEAFRSLRPGGEMLLIERAFGDHKNKGDWEDDDIESAVRDIRSLALRAGFVIEKEERRIITFDLTEESGKSKVSENGFPHYDGLFLSKAEDESKTVCLKLRKPE